MFSGVPSGVTRVAAGTGATVKELLLLLMSVTREDDLPIALDAIVNINEEIMNSKTCLCVTGEGLNLEGVFLISEVICGSGALDDDKKN